MNILLDLNITLDYLITKRSLHNISEELFNCINSNNNTIWISASSIDNLQYILINEAKKYKLNLDTIKLEFEKYLNSIKIFSVTGTSIRESLKTSDLEDHIIYSNFKRIAPDGIVISNDTKFQKYPDVISVEDFIKKFNDSNSSSTKNVPMLDLKEEYRYMLEDIDNAVLNSIAETNYILGPQVKQLEENLTKYLGIKHCIGCSSGTEALVLSLRALAIKTKGQEYFDETDKIITTPFTFTATGDAILHAGATPVFIDVDPATYNIDTNKVKEYLSNSASGVVGIIPVHLYGQSCEMDSIMDIAKQYNLFVIEDVAQAFGAMWKNQKLGTIGTTGSYSFFPSKNLGGFGDGGLVSTNDDKLAELTRMLLKHGGKDKYNVDHLGYNARLDTLQASILIPKLKHIDEFNNRRIKIAEIYTKELKNLKNIILPNCIENAHHVFHQYTIRILDGKREAFQKHLKEKGIDSMVYYPVPLHKMKVFNGRCSIFKDLKNSENLSLNVLSLPVEPLQDESTTKYIIETIKGFFTK